MSHMRGVMVRLERRLGAITAGPTPLEGGITNRNYRVSFAGRDCVVRVPGKDTSLLRISREAERVAGAAAAELGLAPAVVIGDAECLVTEYADGEPAEAAALRSAPEPIGAALRRFHDCGVELPARFWVPELLDFYAQVVSTRGGSLPEAYGRARALVQRIAALLPLTEPVPCHNDLLPANVLRVDGAVVLVDWEYAGMGHRLFDLGNLAVNSEFEEGEEVRLLEAYFGEEPSASRRAGLSLMRVVSDAREAAWGVVQSVVSELEFDFSAYAQAHFERLERVAAGAGFEGWLRAAAA